MTQEQIKWILNESTKKERMKVENVLEIGLYGFVIGVVTTLVYMIVTI
jgi:tetrahydromethanopterin S-methyltransferase subunit G